MSLLIAYFSFRDGKYNLYRKPSDGGGAEEFLVSDDNQTLYADDWSRDGKTLIYERGLGVGAGGGREIWPCRSKASARRECWYRMVVSVACHLTAAGSPISR
jgi:hypothetical protein